MAPQQPVNPNPDEYELVAHDQLEYLHHEVEKIKRNPFGDTQSSKDLLSSMKQLNKNVSKLVAIFETANDEIVRDYKDKTSTEKINRVLEQNEKLAKGIVAIADLLKELRDLRGSWTAPPKEMPSTTSSSAPPLSSEQRNDAPVAMPGNAMLSSSPAQSGPSPAEENPFLDHNSTVPPNSSTGSPSGPEMQGSPAPGSPFPVGPASSSGKKLPPIDFVDIPPPPK